MDLSIVTISWNVKDYLRKCLFSIYSNTRDITFEIIVVDNNSSDGSQKMIRDEFPNALLMENKENLGFAKANNQAIVKSKGEFVLLLNPDTLIFENTISKMLKFIRANPKIGIVGPEILNPDYTLQLSSHISPGPVSLFLTWFIPELFFERFRLLNNQRSREVGYVSGACLLIRRKTIEEIGLLDESFFLYSEEADWSMRARRKKWKVYFLPEAKIIHYARQSVVKYGLAAISKIKVESNYFLIKKHFGSIMADLYLVLVYMAVGIRKRFWQSYLLFCGKRRKGAIEEKIRIYNSIMQRAQKQ